jgi:hypothetical protein
MGRGSSTKANKKKAAEKSLNIIENQDYVAMKVATQIWHASSVKSDALQELANLGLMQSQDLAE